MKTEMESKHTVNTTLFKGDAYGKNVYFDNEFYHSMTCYILAIITFHNQ